MSMGLTALAAAALESNTYSILFLANLFLANTDTAAFPLRLITRC